MEVREEGPDCLERYAQVPITFCLDSCLAVSLIDNGLGGARLTLEKREPVEKNYDTDDSPLSWPARFDLNNWLFILAYSEGEPVGAATVVHDSPEVNLLEGRSDLALLWDIRVRPDFRGQGVGKLLFERAVEISRRWKCTYLKIETQNSNVAACRFYCAMGCELGEIHRHAYRAVPELKDDVMLCWYLDLVKHAG